jgi:uncharacterized Zn-finger protein
MNTDVQCPYCDKWQEINHDDGYGYEEDKLHEQSCSECDKTFVFTTSVMYHYEAFKASCLNDGSHEFKPTMTHPRCFTEMECNHCGERRKPTPEEKRIHSIPSIEDELGMGNG